MYFDSSIEPERKRERAGFRYEQYFFVVILVGKKHASRKTVYRGKINEVSKER